MKVVRDPNQEPMTDIRDSMIVQGAAEILLPRLPSGFFRCCITSPPYWGLRD
jgi:site-specific DNA-methyltransferase (cytosine-N4-specific)